MSDAHSVSRFSLDRATTDAAVIPHRKGITSVSEQCLSRPELLAGGCEWERTWEACEGKEDARTAGQPVQEEQDEAVTRRPAEGSLPPAAVTSERMTGKVLAGQRCCSKQKSSQSTSVAVASGATDQRDE